MNAKLSILSLIAAFSASAQWLSSPFPATEPVIGYSTAPAFPAGFFTGTNRAISLLNKPGETTLYAVCKSGIVYAITNLSQPTLTVFLDNSARQMTDSEAGLHGMAFHPNWASNRYLFTFGGETNTGQGTCHNRLVRWETDPANPLRVLPQSRVVLIEQRDSDPVHQGGDLKFGPDGYLYVPLGEEGVWTTTSWATTSAQRIDRDFFSGILRLDVDGRPGSLPPNPHPSSVGPYWIPSDNPFVGATSFRGIAVNPSSVRAEFWAVGFRNPHRMSFVPGTTNLLVGDVGLNRWEEISLVKRGDNCGWPFMEGSEVTALNNWGSTIPPGLAVPLWSYPHSTIAPAGSDPRFIGNSVIGGFVYQGTRYPHLTGKYLCADFVAGHLWAITLSTPPVIERIGGLSAGPHSLGLDPLTGDILMSTYSGVYRLVQGTQTSLPATLTETGLFTDVRHQIVRQELQPYEVNNPFWSDHAVKSRWFFLPPGTKVNRGTNDSWTFPSGTVWMKHFKMEGVRGDPTTAAPIETRFLVMVTNGVYGLTYRWRPDASDADLVADGGLDESFLIQVSGITERQPWHYPSRGECGICHSPVAGYALGFSTRQLNQDRQLVDLAALGVFNTPFLDSQLAGLPKLSTPEDTTYPLEHRLKSYTDANCAYCHQPGGSGQGAWDARFSVPLANSGIINADPIATLGINGAKILGPGDLTGSLIYRRLVDFTGPYLPADYHMPALATFVRNEGAINLVQQFIGSLGRPVWQLGKEDGNFTDFVQETPVSEPAYYFAGRYPAGFNGLASELLLDADQPWNTFERALTTSDPRNRICWQQAGAQDITLRVGLFMGFAYDKVAQSIVKDAAGKTLFFSHDIVVRFNGTLIGTRTVTGPTVLQFTAPARAGANSVDIERLGSASTTLSYGIGIDFIRLQR